MTTFNTGSYPPGMTQADHDRAFGEGDPDAPICDECGNYIDEDGICDCPPEDDYYAYSPGDTPWEQTS